MDNQPAPKPQSTLLQQRQWPTRRPRQHCLRLRLSVVVVFCPAARPLPPSFSNPLHNNEWVSSMSEIWTRCGHKISTPKPWSLTNQLLTYPDALTTMIFAALPASTQTFLNHSRDFKNYFAFRSLRWSGRLKVRRKSLAWSEQLPMVLKTKTKPPRWNILASTQPTNRSTRGSTPLNLLVECPTTRSKKCLTWSFARDSR